MVGGWGREDWRSKKLGSLTVASTPAGVLRGAFITPPPPHPQGATCLPVARHSAYLATSSRTDDNSSDYSG